MLFSAFLAQKYASGSILVGDLRWGRMFIRRLFATRLNRFYQENNFIFALTSASGGLNL